MMQAIRKQLAVSRNLNESARVKVGRMLWTHILLVKAVWLGLLALREEQLGSQVVYEGRKCYVCNWAGSDDPTLTGPGGFYEKRCPRSKIRNVITTRELLHRFRTGFRFYVTNWIDIEVHEKLYPHVGD